MQEEKLSQALRLLRERTRNIAKEQLEGEDIEPMLLQVIVPQKRILELLWKVHKGNNDKHLEILETGARFERSSTVLTVRLTSKIGSYALIGVFSASAIRLLGKKLTHNVGASFETLAIEMRWFSVLNYTLYCMAN